MATSGSPKLRCQAGNSQPDQFEPSASPGFEASLLASDFGRPGDDTHNTQTTDLELANSQRLWRQAKWSPDGSHLLAQTEGHELDLFRLESSARVASGPSCKPPPASTLTHVLRIKAPTPLLSWDWYTFARANEPSTWCFALSARDVPIRLIDAATGITRATYGIENHVERFVGSQAIAFGVDGINLYAGHETSISIFDVTRAGTNTCTTVPFTPTRKSICTEDQKGIVSCLVVAVNFISEQPGELLAAGTHAGCVGIYYRPSNASPGEWDVSRRPQVARQLCLGGWKEAHGSGITQLTFHPWASYVLFVGLRSSGAIKCYDLRYLAATPTFNSPAPVVSLKFSVRRSAPFRRTNQRIYFHVDWTGRWLASGNENGEVRFWDLLTDDDFEEIQSSEVEFSGRLKRPHTTIQAAKDVVNSVAVHPFEPLLCVSSGSRHFPSAEHVGDDAAPARWHAGMAQLRLLRIAKGRSQVTSSNCHGP